MFYNIGQANFNKDTPILGYVTHKKLLLQRAELLQTKVTPIFASITQKKSLLEWALNYREWADKKLIINQCRHKHLPLKNTEKNQYCISCSHRHLTIS